MMKILMDFPSAYFPIQPFYVKKIKMSRDGAMLFKPLK